MVSFRYLRKSLTVELDYLVRNEGVRSDYFPLVKEKVFLANASVCPLPHPSVAAMQAFMIDAASRGDQETVFPMQVYRETCQMGAQLLGCQEDSISFLGPTSIGLSLVANGIAFKPGQNVVYCPDDYPSNAVVWMNLSKRGVEPRALVPKELGQVTLELLEEVVDKDTALVALTSAHFISGYRLEVDRIGAWLRERGILFCLDAIQTVGALATPVSKVDFLSADSHKWLLGPASAGLFYVHPDAQDCLEPSLLGWRNVVCPAFLTPDKVQFWPRGRRYEAGCTNFIGLIGLHASLKLLLDIGLANIEARVLEHTRFLRHHLLEKGYLLAGEDDRALSGITSFRKEGMELRQLHQTLLEKDIHISLRQTRHDHQFWLRFSPHFYNTEAELERVLAFLP